ncbi:MAG: transporter substrate-binding domain-containing protein, partial [Candidatus Poribacteria bacterium]|nr:transporter substrate-binding domain-containing protein [Candidatus Poribacteria bacterium]
MFWRRAGDKPVAQTVWLACCCLLATVAAMGQEPSDAPTPPLRVTVATFPPLVMERNAALVGFDLDLWKAVATEHEWQYTVEETTFPDLLARVRRGETDVALAGITITEQRETTLDFSHQYLESGLHILARKQTKLRVFSAMKALLTPDKLRWVFYLLLFIALCGHVLWLAERGESAISDHYIPGIFEAFWCVIATMTTVGYGDIAPRTLLGRLAAFGVMIVGIAFFGVALAQLSAGLAVQQFETEVTSLADLRDKRVATVAESTSVDILNDIEATVVPVHEIE